MPVRAPSGGRREALAHCRSMRLIRSAELRLAELFAAGEAPGSADDGTA